MTYNPLIQNRQSKRLRSYDYSKAGYYFITISCDKKKELFGYVVNKNMVLNEGGEIADSCWREIPKHFPNVLLHDHVIMPNHVHGIIEIIDPTPVGTNNYSSLQGYSTNRESSQHDSSLQGYSTNRESSQRGTSPFRSPSRTIGSIVRGFKIGVTKWFRANTDIHKVWQNNYYDRIIWNNNAYHRISEYIRNNPAKW